MMYHKQQSGFSLVETLVAITILLIIIAGPMTISTSAARSTSYASEQVTAFFLAQEGAELAQKIRDDLLVEAYKDTAPNPDPWGDFTDTSNSGTWRFCYQANGCGLATTNANDGAVSVRSCGSGATNCRLYFNNDANADRMRYTYDNSVTASTTIYTRVIKLDEPTPGQVRVISEVRWRSGNFRNEQRATVETFLFDIYGI